MRAESPPHTKRAREYTCSRSIRAGAAAGPGRSSPDAQREVCDGLTPIHLASWARENTFTRNRTRCSDKGSSAATRAVRAAPTTALVGALFTGVLTAAFFDALLATAVFFVAIPTLYPIFFVGCDATSATGRRLKHAIGRYVPQLIAAYVWLDSHRQSDRYLREISAPGVDTKFAERYRPVLAAMLSVSSTASGFLAGLGLRSKPGLVRLRPASSLGLPAPLTELAVRAEELTQLRVEPRVATIIESEISYLSIDVPEDGVVIWGKGFEVDSVGRLQWLREADILYWGDIDTHGFAILDRLRAWLPQARSVLMDRETLLAHRDRWVIEDRPAKSVLTRLTPGEQDLYSDLVREGFGERVRLEQERIDWQWVEQRLTAGSRADDHDLSGRR